MIDEQQNIENEEIKSKNKFSLRYSNSGIILTILILMSFTLLCSYFIEKSNIFYDDSNYEYAFGLFPSEISNSLYDNNEDDGYYQNIEKDSIKYIVRGLKIKNFENTEKFRKRYPNEVVIRDFDDKVVYRTNKKEYREYLKSEYPASEYKVSLGTEIEEPIETVTLLTNIDDLDDSINPQEYEFLNKDSIYGVKGYYENGKIEFTEQRMPTKEYDKFVNAFQKSIKETYKNINSKYYGIEKLNFMYTIDFNSKTFNKYLMNIRWDREVLPSKALATLLGVGFMIAFVMISNYKKLKGVSFAEGLKKFPVEIVIAFSFAWFIPILFVSDADIIKGTINEITIYSVHAVLLFFLFVAIYYYILGFKSIYNFGTNSFIFKNSIIVKMINSVINWSAQTARSAVDYSQENIDFSKESLNKLRIFCIGLLVLGTLGSVMVVGRGLRFIVWVIWTILVALVYKMSKKYMVDLDDITEKSTQIAAGNYDVKIDENTTYFKGIAHNFNNISENLYVAVDEAVKSERMKTELITNVSHDLKTPLTSIINYSDLIVKENTTNSEKDEYAKVIYEKSIKLKHLIEDLFEVSKASSGNVELNLEEIDFRAILMQTAGEWEDKFEDRNLSIVQNLPEEPIILNLDGNKTSRVLDNLFSNIYKYAMPGTRVYVDLFKDEKEVKMSMKNISNYSLNISAEELVDRFKRGDESRNTEGSGLGLSIASSLIEAQGGKFILDIDGDLFKTEIRF